MKKSAEYIDNNEKGSNTSTREASFLGKDPTIEGEMPTSLAPAIIAASLHPRLFWIYIIIIFHNIKIIVNHFAIHIYRTHTYLSQFK